MISIPSQLKENLQKGIVIPFIGAGVSMSVKNKTDGISLFPSWKTLLLKASERLQEEGKPNQAAIVSGFVNTNRFLDAANEAKQALGANWYTFLKQQFDHCKDDVSDDSLELARKVWNLGSKLVITTNYDNVLRWACSQSADLVEWDIEAPAEQCELLRSGVSKPIVWHLHGKIDNAAELILTPDGYQHLYSDKSEQKYKAALKTLHHQLTSRTFLFIGFSLADEDFVRQIEALFEIFKGALGPHYVLLPESQKASFKSPVDCVEVIYFPDFGLPQLGLLDELASFTNTVTIPVNVSGNYEAADYSAEKPVFFVPFASKGEQMIGRENALQRVHDQLHSGKRTAIGQTASFQGLGGLGKTQLAVEYAYTYQNEYVNGVIWINADQDISFQLIQLSDKAGWVSPLSDQALKLTSAIKRLREVPSCLIIFDNLENLSVIEEYLPASQIKSHILITSRREQAGFSPIPLDTLTPRQGLQLLIQEAEREPQTAEEIEAATLIVRKLDGLPLALELAGAYLRRRSSVGWHEYLDVLNESLQDAFPSFLQKESLTRHEADIYSTLKIHESLFEEEPLLKEILDVLTWSGPATMSVSLLCSLLGQEKVSKLTGALSLGCTLKILQRSSDESAYAIHRLVREVRRVELPLEHRSKWMEDIVAKLADWFEKHRQDFTDLSLFEANLDHIKAWQQNSQDLNLPLQASRLIWLQAYPAWHFGRYIEAKNYLDEAQIFYAKSSVQDDELLAHLTNDLGSVVSELLGNDNEALKLSEKALDIRLKLYGDEHQDTALSLSNIANYYARLGKTQYALDLGNKALRIRSALFGEQHAHVAQSLVNLAGYYEALGNISCACELCEKALNIQRRLFGEEHPDIAKTLHNVAGYYDTSGDTTSALVIGHQALRIWRKLFGDEHPETATVLGKLSMYYKRLGYLTEAVEFCEKSWLIRKKLLGDMHPTTIVSNHNLIVYLKDNNQRSDAFNRLEHQLKLMKSDHPNFENFINLRDHLLTKQLRNGFRQPSKSGIKNKRKKRR